MNIDGFDDDFDYDDDEDYYDYLNNLMSNLADPELKEISRLQLECLKSGLSSRQFLMLDDIFFMHGMTKEEKSLKLQNRYQDDMGLLRERMFLLENIEKVAVFEHPYAITQLLKLQDNISLCLYAFAYPDPEPLVATINNQNCFLEAIKLKSGRTALMIHENLLMFLISLSALVQTSNKKFDFKSGERSIADLFENLIREYLKTPQSVTLDIIPYNEIEDEIISNAMAIGEISLCFLLIREYIENIHSSKINELIAQSINNKLKIFMEVTSLINSESAKLLNLCFVNKYTPYSIAEAMSFTIGVSKIVDTLNGKFILKNKSIEYSPSPSEFDEMERKMVTDYCETYSYIFKERSAYKTLNRLFTETCSLTNYHTNARDNMDQNK